MEVKSLSLLLKKARFFLNLRIINGLMLPQRITAVKTKHFSIFKRALLDRESSASLDKLTLW